ncbi:MAG: HAMP domain-containing histidine kinase [SAR324 cluster bacterium]|nr:HAMP domain-containing histidine kinase [SAR324 cluster bacterium]
MEKNGEIRITTRQTPERMEIRVIDNGPGVPAEIAQKIFGSRFTTKGKREGTGLGLTFSQRMMRKYKGDIELENPGGNGEGATFLCWLPLKSS